ncbi:hypothetical protein CPB85DRAFT_1435809 [Mucidula mucida]|nr:hypothetical protein CPB85DRAFT_1435809 [Mucidula mucida]
MEIISQTSRIATAQRTLTPRKSMPKLGVDSRPLVAQCVVLIASTTALDVVTRATRVLAVQDLENNDQPIGKTKVLKDVWLYCDAQSEEVDIFAALKELDAIGGPKDQRPLRTAAKWTTVKGSRGQMENKDTGGVKTAARAPSPAPHEANKPVYPDAQRIHRRIVFEEEGVTLYAIHDYGHFALGLAQLVHGLDRMRLAGLVHGNINPGNCLWHLNERHIKISDLEYARRYDSQGKSALPLTGTPGFMAVEYQSLLHRFQPNATPQEPPSVYDLMNDLMEENQPHQERSWFRFNFLHDLESVLWILLSHLLTTVPTCLHADDPDIVKSHQEILELYDQLFDGSLKGSVERREFIQQVTAPVPNHFSRAGDVLKTFYEKANASALCKVMAAFAYLVRSCYMPVESTIPVVLAGQDSPCWDPVYFKEKYYRDIHKVFMTIHRAMVGVEYHAGKALEKAPSPAGAHENNEEVPQSEENNEEVAPNPEPGPSQPRKRRAENTIDEEPAKKSKSGTRAGTSRSGKRRAEDDVEPETTKKAKGAPAAADEPPRRSLRTKTAASSGAAKGRKAPARKTKQAAGPPTASSSRQPSGAGSSAAAGTSGQAAAGPSRPPRAKRVVESSDRTLRSAKKDKA